MALAKLKILDLGQNNGEHCLAAAAFWGVLNCGVTSAYRRDQRLNRCIPGFPCCREW
jgi:hypothetical protein